MIVCVCNAIGETEVREAARCVAASPVAAYARLGCEPHCGCCLGYAQQLIDQERAKRPQLRVVAA